MHAAKFVRTAAAELSGEQFALFFFLYFEDNYASRTTLQNEFSGNNLSDSSKRLTRQARKS